MKSLKKQTLTLAAITAVAFSGAVSMFAQEDAPLQILVNDSGMDAITDAQNNPAKSVKNIDASEQLQNIMEKKNYNSGWDDEKKRYFVLEQASFDCENPNYNKSFLIQRDAAVKQAVLKAKVKIIEYVATDMSAKDQLTTPGTDLNKKLGEELEELEDKIAYQKNIVQELLAEYDRAKAEKLAGVTWGDRLKAMMDAAIKKLDKEYSTKKISDKKRKRYEEAKSNYLQAKGEMTSLEQKAAALKGTVKATFTSAVETMADMPLYGATVIFQAESWDSASKQYKVAVLLCWSNKLERAVRAIVTGDDKFKIVARGKGLTVHQWIKKQDIAVMSGPRQFIDKNGNRWFVGISSRALPRSSSGQEHARDVSEMMAKQMAAFCLYADVESNKKAKTMMQTRNGGGRDVSVAADSMEKTLTQSFKNKKIRGLQNIYSKSVIHPISGKKIFVAVYGVNQNSAKAALEIEKINYTTKIADNKHQSREKGRKDAYKTAVRVSKDDPESYNKGRQDTNNRLSKEQAKRRGEGAFATAAGTRKKTATGKAKSGTFVGDADVNDDF
jgi:hypothetical protein